MSAGDESRPRFFASGLGPLACLIGVATTAIPGAGQSRSQLVPGQTVEVVPGADYEGSGFRRFFLGDHYRDLWTVPIQVSVLDLGEFAGGLTPLSSNIGNQTTSLRFRGADGRQYDFRSVYKTPVAGRSPELKGSVVADLLQDGASASHPVGSSVVGHLLEAADVVYAQPTLAVIPDDPALGGFRAAFAGMLGTIEEFPNEEEDGLGGFQDALRVIGSSRLFERIDEGPQDQVDASKFLTARLIDILIGDRARHRDQFRWVLLDDSGPVRYWEPISRDHDEAFVKLDGMLLHLATRYFPQLTSFGPEYGSMLNLNWYAREVDRRFLAGVDRAVWDSTAARLQSQITDQIIEDAVAGLPAPMYEVGGAELIHDLKARRDALPEAVDRYYDLLAREVEIHATNAPEEATVTLVDDRFLEVSIRGSDFQQPYFSRRFDARETQEVRINMWGGRDQVLVGGSGDPDITLRIVGGRGRDVMTDSSRVGDVHFSDSEDEDETGLVLGPGSSIDRRPYQEWIGSDLDRYPPREWGSWLRPVPWIRAGPDFGVLLGFGFTRTRYGFRKSPYASDITVRGAIATGDGWGRVDLDGDIRSENSDRSIEFNVGSDGIEILRYYGLGNDTKGVPGAPSNFYKVELNDIHADVKFVDRLGGITKFRVSPYVRRSTTDTDNGGRFFDSVADTLYGEGTFGQVGGEVELEVDARDREIAPTRGAYFRAYGRGVPAMWDVEDAFGRIEGEVRGFLSAPTAWLEPTLAVRAAATRVLGEAPFQDAAYLGGRDNLRGWHSERFAGDASLSGSAELRLALGSFRASLPADYGVFGLVDVGRVYVDGESPGGWHHGFGGGIWLAFLNTVSLAFANSKERNAFYVGLGFTY